MHFGCSLGHFSTSGPTDQSHRKVIFAIPLRKYLHFYKYASLIFMWGALCFPRYNPYVRSCSHAIFCICSHVLMLLCSYVLMFLCSYMFLYSYESDVLYALMVLCSSDLLCLYVLMFLCSTHISCIYRSKFSFVFSRFAFV